MELAKAIGAEIISADSMQVYRYMDIGSAKITPQEMDGVSHHLVDVLDPREEFNVVRFQQMAKQAAADIWSRGNIPLVVGGTGFYIQALLYDIDFTETGEDEAFRRQMEQLAQEEGDEMLHEKLRQVDPESAAAIHFEIERGLFARWNIFTRPAKKFPLTMKRNDKRNLPTGLLILS